MTELILGVIVVVVIAGALRYAALPSRYDPRRKR